MHIISVRNNKQHYDNIKRIKRRDSERTFKPT